MSAAPASDARDRIVRTAYDLFTRHGIRAVGIDRVIAEAGVAKMTLYRHFRSKDELARAVLELRDQLWTVDWLIREVERRGGTAGERLLYIFDIFDEWFRRRDYEGCLFANSLLESHDRTSAIGAGSSMGLAGVRSFLRPLAEEAGVRDPDNFAHQWQILLLGSIVAALDGDLDAATRTREVAALFLERESKASKPARTK
jgi:AcrR family transcriptional regulator